MYSPGLEWTKQECLKLLEFYTRTGGISLATQFNSNFLKWCWRHFKDDPKWAPLLAAALMELAE